VPEAILIRKSLEATTAQLAAERAAASQILVLHAILERQREANAGKDGDAFIARMKCFTRRLRKSPDIPEFGR